MKDYVTLDPDDADADFRYRCRDTMIAQFKQDLYNKNFSLQDQDKRDSSPQKELFFGLIMLLLMKVRQYQIMLMIMIITMMDWFISFGRQRTIPYLENYKNS